MESFTIQPRSISWRLSPRTKWAKHARNRRRELIERAKRTFIANSISPLTRNKW